MKLGQNACLGNCSDEFDVSGEQSRAILALLFTVLLYRPGIDVSVTIHPICLQNLLTYFTNRTICLETKLPKEIVEIYCE
jgi:hypothetical protein